MFAKRFGLLCLLAMALVLSFSDTSEARYLSTRASGDRVDKIRELLKELLETEIEKEDQGDAPPRWHPESKLFYKREAPQTKH
ncbi:uncharacterized protein LOC123320327 [Coccinella septempunctata]|uniref:uncharacterized protein LOC123320327 n=1 Tax=Coccinella septempunctata TaxID=41139 RepID=UPI001D08850E|nr:uncharacterized protein LOC123320327 [Coccinella septempunctata]